MTTQRGQQYRYRPFYVLDVDDIAQYVDFMLDLLEPQMDEVSYQNCITVLDHLMACDEELYGRLLQQEGKKLGKPHHSKAHRDCSGSPAESGCLVP